MPAHPALPEQFGRYRILRKLGEGGMGTVYLAEDTQLGRQVAVKVPHHPANGESNVLERFFREARVAARIEHPNICPVYDVGEIEGIRYFTMPYIDGTPLSQLVSQEQPWQSRQAVDLVCQIAQAVGALHQQGLVHRDLKPSNIMVRLESDPVLMDFGLAKVINTTDQNLTQTGTAMGTPAYMSPEQVLDASSLGPAADVYSLGVILYELLTGRRPFEGPVAAVYAQILHTPPMPPSKLRPTIDTSLDALCLKAMAKKVQDRFPDARAFSEALALYLGPQTIPVQPLHQVPPLLNVNQSEEKRTCASCGRQLRVPNHLRGRKVKCPKCGARLPAESDLPALIDTPPVSVTAPAGSPTRAAQVTGGATLPLPPLLLEPTSGKVQPAKRSKVPLILTVILLLLILAISLWFGLGWLQSDDLKKVDGVKLELRNSIGMEFVAVEPGKFTMGSPLADLEREDDEPEQAVEITSRLLFSRTEVTVGQFREFVAATGHRTDAENGKGGCGYDAADKSFPYGSKFNWREVGFEQTDKHPVVNVSYNDARAFCEWLSKKENRRYDLPREDEWEYACRAKTSTRYWTGDDAESLLGAANLADSLGGEKFKDWTVTSGTDGFVFSAPVASFKQNALGLFDMAGNVWEWCHPFPEGDTAASEERVLRGGSWFGNPSYCRSANRYIAPRNKPHINFGFRVVIRPGN